MGHLTKMEFLKDADVVANGATLGSLGLFSAYPPVQTVTDTATIISAIIPSPSTTPTPQPQFLEFR